MAQAARVHVVAIAGLLGFLLSPGPASAQLRATTYVSGLTQPVGFVQDPSDRRIQYVIEQGGTIRVIRDGVLLSRPFLAFAMSEISTGGERGLLGLAFPPDYGSTGRFYVNYTNPAGHTVVARVLRSAADGLVADKSTLRALVWRNTGLPYIEQPFSNHNGGDLAFGPDGYLYIAMGDGGSGDDPGHRAQNRMTLLGKILRIDVSVEEETNRYAVPADNPFVDSLPVPALHEIWAFGLRNPWQFSFDDPALGGTGAMFIGDVGQGAWEEIDYQPPGAGGRNYGWRNREGAHTNPNPNLMGGNLPPAYTPLIDPIAEYDHSQGSSVIGGVVYRGAALRAGYRGRYFYGDLGGRVWSIALAPAAGGEVTAVGLQEHTGELGGAGRIGLISAFGTDADGELYIVSLTTGTIIRVTDPSAPVIAPPAADLDRDHRPDLVWFHEGARTLAAWHMGGGNLGERAMGAASLNGPALPAGWRVAGTADIDGDSHTDLILQSDTGQLGAWLFNGTAFRFGMSLDPASVSDSQWRIRAVGDFNRDGHSDLVWQYAPTGQVAFWLMNGTRLLSVATPGVGAPGAGWQIFGTGDANRDGDVDLFWQHRTLGTLAVWRMQGTQYRTGVPLSAQLQDANWQAVAVTDLDRDGAPDIVLQHRTTGDLGAWYLNAETLRAGVLLDPSRAGEAAWKIVGPR